MADMESLSLTTDACKGTLVSASKTIRSLIMERNAALAAADPALVAAMQKETEVFNTASTMRADLEAARKDTEAAIAEASANPVLPPKASTAQYPKTLADSTDAKRPPVVVQNARDEAAARAAGFTVQTPPPAAPPTPVAPPVT
jgi:hypothetical protein